MYTKITKFSKKNKVTATIKFEIKILKKNKIIAHFFHIILQNLM